MQSIATENDRRESKLRERKQQIEQERRKRIFNVKRRVIGLDVPAIDKQIEENVLKRLEAERIEAAYNAQMQREGSLAYELSLREKDERKRIFQEIINYRKNFQKAEERREFDLNDPDGWKKDIPPCLREDIGMSSVQKFTNDENTEERKKLMKEQRLAWLEQQVNERKKWEEEQEAAEKAFKQLAITRAEQAMELEKMERNCKRRVEEANIKFNLALAAERKMSIAIEKENDLQDKKADIYNHLTSGLLCEVHDLCASALGPKKILSGAYKGMTPEERARIRKDQIEQIALNKAKRDEMRLEELKWDNLSQSILSHVYAKDSEHQKQSREAAINIFKDNETISAEQTLRKQHLEKLYGNNQPSEEYHQQFNKSTR